MTARNPLRSTARSLALMLAAAGVIGCATLPASAQPPGSQGRPERPTVTVQGSAEVAVPPDQAVVRLGVLAEGATAAEAQEQVNATMQRLLEAVTRRNVPERAIRTEDLSLYPVYGETAPVPRQGRPAEPRIVGYRASNVVSVELEDLEAIGGVIDAGIEAGANQLQGIQFRVRDNAAARADALRRAVDDARGQAEALAQAMGMRLDGVSQAIAGGGSVAPPMPMLRMAEAASTPVQPGEVQISANVTITYFLAGRN